MSTAVNEAVEQAHREGILSTASLMVAGPAADDAVRRAKRLPGLRVGLHVVLVDGPAVLGRDAIPDLLEPSPSGRRQGEGAPTRRASLGSKRPHTTPLPEREGAVSEKFGPNQAALGVRYFFHPRARAQLRAEITAQFAAFAATGLALDHANAHKHMHLHPTVGRLIIKAGRSFGLAALRIPAEPAAVLAACGTRSGFGARLMQHGTALLRRQAHRAGLRTNDHAFGIAWSGHMTAERVICLAHHLPPGLSELYFHPATSTDATLARTMPSYEHAAELATLLDPAVRVAFAEVQLTTYSG